MATAPHRHRLMTLQTCLSVCARHRTWRAGCDMSIIDAVALSHESHTIRGGLTNLLALRIRSHVCRRRRRVTDDQTGHRGNRGRGGIGLTNIGRIWQGCGGCGSGGGPRGGVPTHRSSHTPRASRQPPCCQHQHRWHAWQRRQSGCRRGNGGGGGGCGSSGGRPESSSSCCCDAEGACDSGSSIDRRLECGGLRGSLCHADPAGREMRRHACSEWR